MKIGIASDHRGYKLKSKILVYLKKKGHDVIDFGTNSTESVDYTNFGFRLGEAVSSNEITQAIAICGTGIGISIACNKVKGVRCAKVDSIKEAKLTRKDNDSNILALNGTMNILKALDIVDAFFKTKYNKEERYDLRISQITEYENKKNSINETIPEIMEVKNNEC